MRFGVSVDLIWCMKYLVLELALELDGSSVKLVFSVGMESFG